MARRVVADMRGRDILIVNHDRTYVSAWWEMTLPSGFEARSAAFCATRREFSAIAKALGYVKAPKKRAKEGGR